MALLIHFLVKEFYYGLETNTLKIQLADNDFLSSYYCLPDPPKSGLLDSKNPILYHDVESQIADITIHSEDYIMMLKSTCVYPCACFDFM